MMMTARRLDFILTHEGEHWIARREGIEIRAADAAALDNALARRVRALPGLKDAAVTLILRFDMSALPPWLHQYAGHYFNRILHLPPADEPASDRPGATP